MIELSLWDCKEESWEKELIKNPKYLLRTVPKLRDLCELKLISENPEIEKSIKQFIPDLSKLKKFIISDIPCCLKDEKISVYVILGANPKIGVDLDTVPNYIRGDEILVEDLWGFIIDEISETLNSNDDVKDLYEKAEVKIIEKLTKFPKDFNKRESYYYDWSTLSSGFLLKNYTLKDYWDSFDLFYKISVFGENYLMDIKHSSSGNRVMIYSYKTKNQIPFKINQRIIIELFNYYLWKI